MVKLTNGQMFDALVTLSSLDERGKLGYAIARNRRKLMDANREYMEVRDKLLRQLGTPKGNDTYTIPPEKAAEFMAELTPYAGIAHDVDVMRVSPEDFCGGNLTSQQMYSLDWMVEE